MSEVSKPVPAPVSSAATAPTPVRRAPAQQTPIGEDITIQLKGMLQHHILRSGYGQKNLCTVI